MDRQQRTWRTLEEGDQRSSSRLILERAECLIGMAESYTGDATECVQITRFYHATGRRIRSLPVPEVVLDADGLQGLRAFRKDLREVMTRAHDAAPGTRSAAPVLHSTAAALQLAPDGSVRCQPQETGQQALVTLVLAALYEGQLAGTRMRLKTCRNPQCPLAFYDRSRNASGVWCSVRICGNAINLRAHRERRRVQGT
jgi:predicted RNA-binding Zn ribbon-like protein